MPRVVSLIASATEIVCALGFEDQLVGRSHECDFPESVKRLPVCTEPKFDVEGSSYEIDQRVKAVLQEGLSVYRVHADLLKQLAPDVIVTQSHCEVCAVSLRDVERAVCDWLDARPQVVSLAPNGLADVWDRYPPGGRRARRRRARRGTGPRSASSACPPSPTGRGRCRRGRRSPASSGSTR